LSPSSTTQREKIRTTVVSTRKEANTFIEGEKSTLTDFGGEQGGGRKERKEKTWIGGAGLMAFLQFQGPIGARGNYLNTTDGVIFTKKGQLPNERIRNPKWIFHPGRKKKKQRG